MLGSGLNDEMKLKAKGKEHYFVPVVLTETKQCSLIISRNINLAKNLIYLGIKTSKLHIPRLPMQKMLKHSLHQSKIASKISFGINS